MDSKTQVNKLVVIGLGLIGGSLAKGLKQANECSEVIGIARKEETCCRAIELDIVDRAYVSIEPVANELTTGDVIFVAVPTLSIRSVFMQLKTCISPEVTITDGASAKGSVRDDVKAVYGEVPSNIILGHPIAGSEKSGVEAADENLYRGYRVILTPCEVSAVDHIDRVEKMWEAVGASVIKMDVDDHDEVLASTSHLPHAIAFSLVDTLAHDSNNENIFRYAAGGFRDFTRIASSDAIMWRDIMLANRQAVLNSIDLFSQNLSRLREMIDQENSTELTGVFTRAKERARSLY